MINVERLLDDEGTLYDTDPREIAQSLQGKLNELERSSDIVAVTAIPDYHTVGADGGTKDIFILTSPKRDDRILDWQTSTLRGEDTMHGWDTADIQDTLQAKITDLEERGFVVRHTVAITDSHMLPVFMPEGIGGFDGLKDMILCYHPSRDLPR